MSDKFKECTIKVKDKELTIFQVKMSRFGNGEMRTVVVPTEKLTGTVNADLNEIYHYGQNDFALLEQKLPSVSMGDIIEYDNALYIVQGMGFKKLDGKEGEIIIQAQQYVEDSIEYSKFLYANLKPLNEKLYSEITLGI